MAINVLIVDDSPAMRKFVSRVLDLSGLSIGARFEAQDGNHALEVLRREWVDVVLTDINMPGMNGEQLVERLAQDQTWQSVPVIVVSTDGTDARIHRLRSLGAKGYIRNHFARKSCGTKCNAF